MKKALIDVAIAIAVMLVTAIFAHVFGVSDWGGCFSAGVGAGIAYFITSRWQRKKMSTN